MTENLRTCCVITDDEKEIIMIEIKIVGNKFFEVNLWHNISLCVRMHSFCFCWFALTCWEKSRTNNDKQKCVCTQKAKKKKHVCACAFPLCVLCSLDSFVNICLEFSHVLNVIPYLSLDSILQLTHEIKVKCENARKTAKILNENGRVTYTNDKYER